MARSSPDRPQIVPKVPLYGDVNVAAHPTIGFSFPTPNPFLTIPDLSYIAPGEHSKVLYAQSDLPPGLVSGNVINGMVHNGQIVGPVPVPEPSTIVLLIAGLGGLGYALQHRRKFAM